MHQEQCSVLKQGYGNLYSKTDCLPMTGGHSELIFIIGAGCVIVGTLIILLLLRNSEET